MRKSPLLIILVLLMGTLPLLAQNNDKEKKKGAKKAEKKDKKKENQPEKKKAGKKGKKGKKKKKRRRGIHLNFNGTALVEIIQTFQKLTKKRFVFNEKLVQNKKVNFVSSRPLPRSSLFAIFQTILEVEGLALVPAGPVGDKIYKIVAAKDGAKKPTPILNKEDIENLPSTDRLVTLVYRLEYASSDDIIKTLTPLVSIPNGVGAIEGTSLIRITDYASNIKRINQILKVIDKQGETPATELVRLENVHPADLVKEIQPIIQLKNQQQIFRLQRYLARRLRRYIGRRGRAQMEMGSIPSSSYIPISVSPVTRLRSVLVSSSKKKIPEVKKIIKQLDVKDPQEKIFRSYDVKYAQVMEISQALSNIFGLAIAEVEDQSRRRRRRRRRGRRGRRNNLQNLTQLEKNAIIIPDSNRNAVMVVASRQVHDQVEKIMKKIDVPGPQDNELKYYRVKFTDLMETANVLGHIYGIRVARPNQGVWWRSWISRSIDSRRFSTNLKFSKERIIIPDENLRTLIVVAPRVIQNEIEKTLDRVDVIGPRENVLQFYEVDDPSKVEEVAQTLSHIFNISIGRLGRRFRRNRRNTSTSKFGVEEIIIPNSETGTLLISAPPEIHKNIGQIVSKLNVYSEEERLVVEFYKLENTNAENIAQKISTLFNLPLGQAASRRNSRNRNTRSNRNRNSRLRLRSNRNRRRLRSSKEDNRDRYEVSQKGEEDEEDKDKDSSPRGRNSNKYPYLYQGEPKVLPDNNLNSVIVIAPKQLHDEIGKLVKKLDQRRPQVMFEVAILDVSASDDSVFSAELATVTHPAPGGVRVQGFSNFGNSGFSDNQNPGGFPDGKNVSPPLGMVTGIVRGNAPTIPLLLRALQTTNNVKIRSTPLILVNDNETAEFRSLRQEPTTTTVTGTATTNIVFSGFVDAGTVLTITPHISEGNYIRVEISLEVENFVGNAPAPGIPPGKTSNFLNTSITVPDSSTVIIGGLESSSTRKTVDKIPFLGDIPLLGLLFRSTRTEKLKSKLYLFIRPKILSDAQFADLRGISLKKVQEVYGKDKKDSKKSPSSRQSSQSEKKNDKKDKKSPKTSKKD